MKSLAQLVKNIAYSGLELFGRYYSDYRAFVVDNEDPENMHRLKLIIPEIAADQVYDYWAYPKDVWGGKDYGIQVLPQKADLVWVSFERGNPEVPIWFHGHWGKDEKPTGSEYKDPNSYWFKTPGGHTVMINDTNEYIYAELKGGEKYIKIHKDKTTIKWKDSEINLDTLINVKTQNESLYTLMDDLFTFLEQQTFTNGAGTTFVTNQLTQLMQLHARLPKLLK